MSMTRFSAKPLRSLSSSSSPLPYSIFVSHFCSSSSSTRHNFPRRHHEEVSRNVRVSVWWDFENCHLPCGVNVFKVSQMITAAVREIGIKGPIQITAFGDVLQLSRANQEALSSTGIQLAHVPRGGKNSADRSLLVDLMYWVSQNPPPAHLFLISGDRDFASVLHRLRMNNYNIMLASLDNAPGVLCSAASIMWRWNALVKGECLTGKVFNQPPDGPYGSWYGHYKAALEDPFSVDQPTLPQTEELTEASSEPKVRPVPKSVIKQIKDVLSSNPEGINISDLRSQLNIIDKEYFGHKTFSRFLMSMPNILKRRTINGTHIIHGIGVKEQRSKPNSCLSDGPLTSDSKDCRFKPMKLEGEEMSISDSVLDPLVEPGTERSTKKIHDFSDEAANNTKNENSLKGSVVSCSNDGVSSSVADEKPLKQSVISDSNDEVIGQSVAPDNISPGIQQDSTTEVGFFKKIWRRWFGKSEDGSVIDNNDISEKPNPLGVDSEKGCENIVKKDGVQADSPGTKGVEEKSVASTSSELTQEKETSMSLEPDGGKSWESPGLLTRFLQWFRFGPESPNSNVMADEPVLESNQVQSHSGKHEIFSDDSFWRDMDSFFDSEQGSLVSQSKTREEMARRIQKDGPLALKTIEESDLLRLVDILISEKKWVEENPSKPLPFKLTRSANASSNGLLSIFSSSSSQSNTDKQLDRKEDEKPGRVEIISQSGVTKPVIHSKPSERSRKETLIDCKKLVYEIMEENPEGFNIGCFKDLFRERYGYTLDTHKLGYPRLASLLQKFPGVKLESCNLMPSSKPSISRESKTIPSGKAPPVCDVPNSQEINTLPPSANSCSDLSDALQSDDSDSQWEELGPLTDKKKRQKEPQYEPLVSDDELTESEGELLTLAQPKVTMDTEDSSLLRILDSWYSSNDEVHRKETLENVQPSSQSSSRSKAVNSVGKCGKSQRTHKGCYSFVAESGVHDSDGSDSGSNDPNKLIDGIIGRLKTAKPSRPRMRS